MQPRDHTRNDHDINKPKESRGRTHDTVGRDRLITLLAKQGRDIHDQDNIIERIEEFYMELYDSEQTTTIHSDLKEVYHRQHNVKGKQL